MVVDCSISCYDVVKIFVNLSETYKAFSYIYFLLTLQRHIYYHSYYFVAFYVQNKANDISLRRFCLKKLKQRQKIQLVVVLFPVDNI